MLKLKDVVDILHRRLRYAVIEDGVNAIYLNLHETTVDVNIILDRNATQEELAKIGSRYSRIFSDSLDVYNIKILPATNYYKPKSSNPKVFTQGLGFI